MRHHTIALIGGTGFIGRQLAAFVSDRRRLADNLILELGLRFDENEVVDSTHLSPRLNLVWSPSARRVVRFAAGRYYQSQRANELRAGDGEVTFDRDESSTQYVLGFDTELSNGLQLRAEAYLREIDDPATRYENLIDPVTRVPEAEIDRVRISPDESESTGVEVLLRRRSRRFDWWASYSYSRTEDQIDSATVPRGFDQPHSLVGTMTSNLGEHWVLSATGKARSGWPVTPFELEIIEGPEGQRVTSSFGPLYSRRLENYFRLDLRVARTWRTRRAEVELWLTVLNAGNRANPRGFSVSVPRTADTELHIGRADWLPRAATAGLSWRF